MRIRRIFNGLEGRSEIEELADDAFGSMLPATGIQIRSTPAGHFMDWHPAPRRQFVIVLAGEMEIGLEDGSVHTFGPGDVLLAEDVTGKGHTRRVSSTEPRISATIPLG
jgi:uncharacterized cupin superfamily protein